MSSKKGDTPAPSTNGIDVKALLRTFGAHLTRSLAKDRYSATLHDRYLALSLSIRDQIVERWIETQQTYHRLNVKRVYYISMEYLLGQSLHNNMVNLGLDSAGRKIIRRLGPPSIRAARVSKRSSRLLPKSSNTRQPSPS